MILHTFDFAYTVVYNRPDSQRVILGLEVRKCEKHFQKWSLELEFFRKTSSNSEWSTEAYPLKKNL